MYTIYTENDKIILRENKAVLNRGNSMFVDWKTPDYKNINFPQIDIQTQYNPKQIF